MKGQVAGTLARKIMHTMTYIVVKLFDMALHICHGFLRPKSVWHIKSREDAGRAGTEGSNGLMIGRSCNR